MPSVERCEQTRSRSASPSNSRILEKAKEWCASRTFVAVLANSRSGNSRLSLRSRRRVHIARWNEKRGPAMSFWHIFCSHFRAARESGHNCITQRSSEAANMTYARIVMASPSRRRRISMQRWRCI
eukprot:8999555-Pyramimonas_sp.AAC.1